MKRRRRRLVSGWRDCLGDLSDWLETQTLSAFLKHGFSSSCAYSADADGAHG